jgi:hypothetical protein
MEKYYRTLNQTNGFFLNSNYAQILYLFFTEAYKTLESKLPFIPLGAGDTINCSKMAFGPGQTQGPSVIPILELQDAIPSDLLEQAGFISYQEESGSNVFDSLSLYYALGRLGFGENKEGLIIGRYRNERQYSAHVFVFDKAAASFVGTQSLHFVLEGGNYKGARDAWITDLNGDGSPDVVYNFKADFESEDPELAYSIRDSLHAEAWTGKAFADLLIDDPDMLRQALGL